MKYYPTILFESVKRKTSFRYHYNNLLRAPKYKPTGLPIQPACSSEIQADRATTTTTRLELRNTKRQGYHYINLLGPTKYKPTGLPLQPAWTSEIQADRATTTLTCSDLRNTSRQDYHYTNVFEPPQYKRTGLPLQQPARHNLLFRLSCHRHFLYSRLAVTDSQTNRSLSPSAQQANVKHNLPSKITKCSALC